MKKILYIILISLMVILGILLYSRFIGTKGLKTNEIIINNENFINFDGLKIIHFSDLHYKKVITEKQVQELIIAINQTKPDIVIFTGDLLDKDYTLENKDINFLIKELSKLKSKYGTYSILGDHDLHELETIRSIYIQSNITLLDNSATTIVNENNNKLELCGISGSLKNTDTITINSETTDTTTYQIIITHEPDNIKTILNLYPNTPLILAGHSINGSINLPIIKQLLLPKGAKSYYQPYYQENQTDIYISNGIGVNQINFRLFNPPSINLYRFKKSN